MDTVHYLLSLLSVIFQHTNGVVHPAEKLGSLNSAWNLFDIIFSFQHEILKRNMKKNWKRRKTSQSSPADHRQNLRNYCKITVYVLLFTP